MEKYANNATINSNVFLNWTHELFQSKFLDVLQNDCMV